MRQKSKYDTSEYKVTYLIGAGASANALPTVKKTQTTGGIANSMRKFADTLIKDSSIIASHKDYVDKMAGDLHWLAVNSDKFLTPDTFAKFLYLNDQENLVRLKNAMSFYFTVEQFINDKFDNRALIFLTTVMQIKGILPTNIKILNWNYDFQIQLAGEVFREEKFYPPEEGSASSHHQPIISYFPTLGFARKIIYDDSNESNEVSMVHLNGIAGFYYDKQSDLILNDFLNQKPKDINEIIEKVHSDNQIRINSMIFAWEQDTEGAELLRNRTKFAKSVAKDTDILVIIGYSFPDFNHAVDKQIFEALTATGKLKKIFYQDPIKTGEFLRKQFELSEGIEITHISEVDNYYVPKELLTVA